MHFNNLFKDRILTKKKISYKKVIFVTCQRDVEHFSEDDRTSNFPILIEKNGKNNQETITNIHNCQVLYYPDRHFVQFDSVVSGCSIEGKDISDDTKEKRNLSPCHLDPPNDFRHSS